MNQSSIGIKKIEPLINKIIIYGVKHQQNLSLSDIKQNKIEVGVLHHVMQGEVVRDNKNDDFYQMWGYPDGIKIYDKNLSILNDSQPEFSFGRYHNISIYNSEYISNIPDRPTDYIYSFVHTDYELNRSYFTCLCWHEKQYCSINGQKIDRTGSRIYYQTLPKCTLWELQHDPLMLDSNSQLVYIPKIMMVASKYPLFIFQRQILRFYYRNVLNETENAVVQEGELCKFKQLINLLGYPEAEYYYDKQQDQLLTDKNKRFHSIDKSKLLQFYTSFVFLPSFEQNIYQIQLQDSCNSSIKFTPILYSNNLCFSVPNINLIETIKSLGIKNLISLWKCFLLQKHILIFSMNNLKVIELCQALFYLIEPLKWQNIYIPFLPFHLINNIDACQSYIIGMSRIHMDYVIEHFKMDDIVLVDLDQNVIIEEGGKKDAELPQYILQMMVDRLNSLGFRKEEFFFFFKREEDKMNKIQRIFKIKCVFFDALLYLMNNYRPHAVFKQRSLDFDRQGYLSIFKEESCKQFIKGLCNTMMFIRLCQYHLDQQKILQWNQSNIGGLFVYCQNILSEKGKNSFWELPSKNKEIPYYEYVTYVINQNMQKLTNQKKVIRLEHYLIKYLNLLQLNKSELIQDRQIERREESLIRSITNFIFPWMRQIQQQQINQGNKCRQRQSLFLKYQKLVDLRNLFSFMKKVEIDENKRGKNRRKDKKQIGKISIKWMLQNSEVSNYVDRRLIKRMGNISKQRVSV